MIASELRPVCLEVARPRPATAHSRGGRALSLVPRALQALPVPTRRTTWTYVLGAAVDPVNLCLFVAATLLSLVCGSPAMLFGALALEGALLVTVWRSGWLRRVVATSMDRAERARMEKARAALLLQMADRHRQDLTKIDRLLEELRDNLVPGGCAATADDVVGGHRLTTGFIQLAIAHRRGEDSLARTSRDALDDSIRALEAVCARSKGTARRLVERRLSIARMRAECWDKTRQSVETIGHQLAALFELVHLMHERSATASDSRCVRDDIDAFLDEVEHSESTLRQLAEVGLIERLDADQPADVAERPD